MTTNNAEGRRAAGWWAELENERSGDEGIAGYIWRGARRHGPAFLAALVVSYGGVAVLLFTVVSGAVLGALVAALLSLALLVAPEYLSFIGSFLPAGAGGAGLGVLGGLFVGALGGFLWWLGSSSLFALTDPVGSIVGWVGNMLPGLLLALVLLAGLVVFERRYLEVARGCRRMSRREAERVEPILDELCGQLGARGKPAVMVHDRPAAVQAYAHVRHVVICRTTLDDLDDEELAGLVAHELGHWMRADSVGLSFVYFCALPIILVYNLAMWVLQAMPTVVTLIIWLFAWPAWASVRFILAPIVGLFSRRHEYRADRTAVEAGYGEGLYRVLERVRDLEPGRTGWERTLSATHPPTELRLEALERAMEEPEEEQAAVVRCASCGAGTGISDRFCRSCGATVEGSVA